MPTKPAPEPAEAPQDPGPGVRPSSGRTWRRGAPQGAELGDLRPQRACVKMAPSAAAGFNPARFPTWTPAAHSSLRPKCRCGVPVDPHGDRGRECVSGNVSGIPADSCCPSSVSAAQSVTQLRYRLRPDLDLGLTSVAKLIILHVTPMNAGKITCTPPPSAETKERRNDDGITQKPDVRSVGWPSVARGRALPPLKGTEGELPKGLAAGRVSVREDAGPCCRWDRGGGGICCRCSDAGEEGRGRRDTADALLAFLFLFLVVVLVLASP